jgi:hypothetical protein
MEITLGSSYTDEKGLICKVLDIGPHNKFVKGFLEKPNEIYVKYETITNNRPLNYPKIGNVNITSKKAFLIWAKKEIKEGSELEKTIEDINIEKPVEMPSKKIKQTYYILPDGKVTKDKPSKYVGTLRAINIAQAKELAEKIPKDSPITIKEEKESKIIRTYYLTPTGVSRKKPFIVIKKCRAKNIAEAKKLLE